MRDQNSFFNTMAPFIAVSPFLFASAVFVVYCFKASRRNNNSKNLPTNSHRTEQTEIPPKEILPARNQAVTQEENEKKPSPTPAAALPASSYAVNIFRQQIEELDQAKRIGSSSSCSSSFDSCDETDVPPAAENTGTYSPNSSSHSVPNV